MDPKEIWCILMKPGSFPFAIVLAVFCLGLYSPISTGAKNGIIYLGPDPAVAPAAVMGATIGTVAGSGKPGFGGDDGPAIDGQMNVPLDVKSYIDGTFMIADFNNHRIRRFDPRTLLIHTVAGNGINAVTGNGGLAINAAISSPRSLAMDAYGNVFISTLHQIRKINPKGEIELFAGSEQGDIGNNVPARQAKFKTLGGLAIDKDGGLLLCDTLNNKVHKVRLDNIVVTIAGTGYEGHRGDNGQATQAELDRPVDVAVGQDGTIFIAEHLGNRIRQINDGIITTIYDSSVNPEFLGPRGLAVYQDLFLYFTSDDNRIRRMNLFDQTVEVVAGNGKAGFGGDTGPASEAFLNAPIGIQVDGNGNLYFADSLNHVIRQVSMPPHNIPATPTPTPTSTPSWTPTLNPTLTPTRTPRPRTPTPTDTPIPTMTATATPTALPLGQLAPAIPSGFSPSPKYVFFTGYTLVDIPYDPAAKTVRVLLSSTTDGTGQLLTRDTIVLESQRPSGTIKYATITFEDVGTPKSAVVITDLFEKGRNVVNVKLIDSKGAGFSNSQPLFVVVMSAPFLRDIPDIRMLVGEEVKDVVKLSDYISDIDTPASEIIWSVTASQDGPVVQRSSENTISLGAFGRPIETKLQVFASDGIFNVSEEMKIKVSSFRLNDFILPDAPLLADFAYRSNYSLLKNFLDPADVNVADVPFDTTFTGGKGLKAAHVAHGEVLLIPEFPGNQVISPLQVAITGKRKSNTDDWDGAVLNTSSVFLPKEGNADRDFNFSAENLGQTHWMVKKHTGFNGEVYLGPIPPEPVSSITDGWGAIFSVDPGQTVSLLSQPISLPAGPVAISIWFAAENLSGPEDEMPSVTLALAEDSSNLAYTTVRRSEILGKGLYQYLCTYYDVIGPETQALIQVYGSQNVGKVEVYTDNLRVFPIKRDIDLALGSTRLPFDFSGNFEDNLEGYGLKFTIDQDASYGLTDSGVYPGRNRTIVPGGQKRSLRLGLIDPESAIQFKVGPNPIDPQLLPSLISARAYVQVTKKGLGFFALGLSNGDQSAVSFISNDRLPEDPEWRQVTATGLFTRSDQTGPFIVIQNENTEGAYPGVIQDGATLVVDDISLEAFQDTPYFWDRKRFPTTK